MDFPSDQSSNTKRIDRYFYSHNELLGQGAFGTVYTGHDIDNKNLLYAIKVIPVSLIKTDPALEEALMNEMKVMKLLNHPNLVRCHDVLSSSNNHYFIMEYCSGGTLSHYLKKRGKLPETEALNILTQILKGYHEMLKLGIIHRDLKPDNILVHEGVYKLADFGFAKCVDNFSKDLMKSLVGTPLYMSPQILQQQEYSTKTDLWSIALIYYEMLFGKTPWEAKTQFELVTKILHQPVKFPAEVKISDESKSFLLGALNLEENARLSWDEVFSHNLFNDCFDYKRRKTTLMEKAMNYQGLLKSKIIEKNIDLSKLFSIIDKNKNNALEMNEFAELMKKLDDKISREQIEFLFNSIDEDGNNSISIYEFRKWLMTSTPIQNQAKNILQRNQTLPIAPSFNSPVKAQNYSGTPSNFTQMSKEPSEYSMPQNLYNPKHPNFNQGGLQDSQGQRIASQGFLPPLFSPPQPGLGGPPLIPPYPYGNFSGPCINLGGFGGQNPGEMFNQSQGYNQFNNSSAFQFQQNQYGNNYVPMQMQGASYNGNVREIIAQIRSYIHKNQSNVERVFNLARGEKSELDRIQFGGLIQMINLPMVFTQADLDMVFREFDLNKDGMISLFEFKKIILNT